MIQLEKPPLFILSLSLGQETLENPLSSIHFSVLDSVLNYSCYFSIFILRTLYVSPVVREGPCLSLPLSFYRHLHHVLRFLIGLVFEPVSFPPAPDRSLGYTDLGPDVRSDTSKKDLRTTRCREYHVGVSGCEWSSGPWGRLNLTTVVLVQRLLPSTHPLRRFPGLPRTSCRPYDGGSHSRTAITFLCINGFPRYQHTRGHLNPSSHILSRQNPRVSETWVRVRKGVQLNTKSTLLKGESLTYFRCHHSTFDTTIFRGPEPVKFPMIQWSRKRKWVFKITTT